ncbi:uncharacterized protein JCM6883_006196 [Sporobolomyces salmoneus]|uniref:uncharacterized protein n=1 Tax=Sporobolomyces salmoneus TaxID=183962 RepID=UPI00316F3B9A
MDPTANSFEPGPQASRRQPLPDQSMSWRAAGPTSRGRGRGGGSRGGGGQYNPQHFRQERAPPITSQESSSIWSTGDYRPLCAPPPRRPGSRSPSPPPYASAPSGHRSTQREDTPERRQKLHQRSTPVPVPSSAYLSASSIVLSSSQTSREREKKPPMLLILDLNHTLLCRSERNRSGSKVPLVRPYLSTFLEYITLSSEWIRPIVFSSARFQNVISLLIALNLIPPPPLPTTNGGFTQPPPPTEYYECGEDDVLSLIWTRENMGLNSRDFRGDVETTKDLEGVWRALELGTTSRGIPPTGEELERRRNLEGAKRTILLDDEVSKAAQQPYSLLPIKPFLLTRSDFPPIPPFQPKSPTDLPPPPFAVELNHPHDHPLWEDRTLLSVIYQLTEISRWGNISSSIRSGGLDAIRKTVKEELEQKGTGEEEVSEEMVEGEMERRGEELCKGLGIQVRKEWDKGWREGVLERKRQERILGALGGVEER